jgi:hypothetical protein
MMKHRVLGVVVLVAAIASSALAGFEPLFRIVKVTGDCSLQRPEEAEFLPAEESKAYPFGTKVRTGMRSSLVIVFSEGNVCRVLANAYLTMDEGMKNKKLKIIRLHDGEVEVELEEEFHKDGNALNVETATAICGAVGCKFRVASKVEEELRIVIVRVIEGIINMLGEDFSIVELDKDDWISLLSPPDESFLRLKTMKGEFEVKIKDETQQDKQVPTEEGTVLKIWQKKVPGTNQRVVTAVLTGPDGQLIETITVTYEEGQPPVFGLQEDGDTAPWGGDEEPRGDEVPPPPPQGQEPGDDGRGNPKYDPDFDGDDPDPDPGQDDLPDTPTEVGLR